MDQLKIWLTSFISFILLDALWFSAFAGKFAKEQLGGLLKTNAQGGIDLNIKAAIIIYLFMGLAVVFFVVPKTLGLSPLKSALWGALLGAIIFGVYELTNYSLIKGWTVPFVIVDIIWGAAAFFVTTLVVKLIFKI